jgi:hypothetical protein
LPEDDRVEMLRALFLVLGLPFASQAAQGDSADLRLGERMYREGVLPSGKPVRASVKGEVPTDGVIFSCVNCHLRSGMGSKEGVVEARPVSGPRLYSPLLRRSKTALRRKPRPPQASPGTEVLRPAYTDVTLARALRDGIDPAGRTLDAAMPRFVLDDREMGILIRYLKTLSAQKSPGATDTTLRFATVMTEGVEDADRDALLATLEAYVEDLNAEPRRPVSRPPQGAFFLDLRNAGRPRLELSRWHLKGPPEGWRGQLDALQRARPVFGLLSGLAAGEWRPIHAFCEEVGLPSLFPITELPVVSGTDWHSLYFSKGLYQEGGAAARFLRSLPGLEKGAPLIELMRDTPEGRALAQGFEETWRASGGPSPERRVLGAEDESTAAALEGVAAAGSQGTALLWLGSSDLSALWRSIAGPRSPRMVFVSSGLLGGALDSIPEHARRITYLTYQGPLPQEQRRRMAAIEPWFKAHGVPLTRPAVQSRAYFCGWMLSAALARMGGDSYRDYLLDLMDGMGDQTHAIAAYERVSFGPGQRYASKGCYVVQLGPGPRAELLKRSEWVVH